MAKHSGFVKYFAEPGPENTEDVVKAVVERIKAGGVEKVFCCGKYLREDWS